MRKKPFPSASDRGGEMRQAELRRAVAEPPAGGVEAPWASRPCGLHLQPLSLSLSQTALFRSLSLFCLLFFIFPVIFFPLSASGLYIARSETENRGVIELIKRRRPTRPSIM